MGAWTDQVDRLFAAWDRPDSPGVALAVVRDGQVVYSRGYGMADLERSVPLGPHSVFDIASTSKQFTACCVLLLANEGRLSLDDDVRTYFPQLPDYGRPITVRHLVHHTSGIRDYLELMRMAGMSWEYDYYEEEVLALLARQKALNFAPGEEHLYSNTGYFLLGEIVRRVSGQALGQFAQERIFRPLGMASTCLYDDFTRIVPRRAVGYALKPQGGYGLAMSKLDLVGDGGVLTTVEDLALWERNFYDNRLGGGAGLIQQMLTVGTLNSGKTLDYAFGLVVGKHRGRPMISHSGGWVGYSAELVRFPEQRLAVACLSNVADTDCTSLALRVAGLYLAGYLEPEEAAEAVCLPEEELAARTGTYHDPRTGTVLKVALEQGRLVVHHPQGLKSPLVPLGPDRFRTAESSPVAFEALFEAAGEERPRQMRLVQENEEPATFAAVEVVPPEPAVLAEYRGTYTSAELDATYRFHVQDGALFLKIGYAPPVPLEPLAADTWSGEGMTLRFARDEAGRVSGVEAQMGRVKGIWFGKQGAGERRRRSGRRAGAPTRRGSEEGR
jgi:CubicO group peptidase (beta-lactamase class C family)